MKKNYIQPQIQIVRMEVNTIIATSNYQQTTSGAIDCLDLGGDITGVKRNTFNSDIWGDDDYEDE